MVSLGYMEKEAAIKEAEKSLSFYLKKKKSLVYMLFSNVQGDIMKSLLFELKENIKGFPHFYFYPGVHLCVWRV